MDIYADEQFLDAIQGRILWLIVPFTEKIKIKIKIVGYMEKRTEAC
jgi:hypothetical protein